MTMNMVLVTEELSKACGGIALSFAGTALGVLPILIAGNEEQKQRFLPGVASGERLCAFAITEPMAGSDAGGIRTTALRDGDHYVLNGTKQWITNGGEAEIYTVVALTNPEKGPRGASVLVVEKDTPGFSFGKKEDKMGIRASATRELIFEDCRVPAENLLGREGTGFITAMKTFDASRRPGCFGPGGGLLHRPTAIRTPRLLFSGTSVHDGRHGHEGGGRKGSHLFRCPAHRFGVEAQADHVLGHGEVLRR
jgi:alkylation response protein AidB-like acyl-CoA dehydrogenase